jgi:hypothetical protein
VTGRSPLAPTDGPSRIRWNCRCRIRSPPWPTTTRRLRHEADAEQQARPTRAERASVLGEDDGLGWTPRSDNGASETVLQPRLDTQEYEFALRLPELLLMRIGPYSMSMAFEAWAPFFDPELVDSVYPLAVRRKLLEGRSNAVLRDAVAAGGGHSGSEDAIGCLRGSALERDADADEVADVAGHDVGAWALGRCDQDHPGGAASCDEVAQQPVEPLLVLLDGSLSEEAQLVDDDEMQRQVVLAVDFCGGRGRGGPCSGPP